MQYQATVSTCIEEMTGYRLLLSIRANDLAEAKRHIEKINNDYPDWDMVLHNDTAFPDNVIMPVARIDKKGQWIEKLPDWASLSTITKV
jgi:hypothetical protein